GYYGGIVGGACAHRCITAQCWQVCELGAKGRYLVGCHLDITVISGGRVGCYRLGAWFGFKLKGKGGYFAPCFVLVIVGGYVRKVVNLIDSKVNHSRLKVAHRFILVRLNA